MLSGCLVIDQHKKAFKKAFKKEVKMKFKIVECVQCGSEFKITNPKQVYCLLACRSTGHRDRHG